MIDLLEDLGDELEFASEGLCLLTIFFSKEECFIHRSCIGDSDGSHVVEFEFVGLVSVQD